jgi:hypothetical protein
LLLALVSSGLVGRPRLNIAATLIELMRDTLNLRWLKPCLAESPEAFLNLA